MGKGPSPQAQQRCANEGHEASWSQLKCGFEIVAGQPRGCDWQCTKRENQSQSVEQECPLDVDPIGVSDETYQSV